METENTALDQQDIGGDVQFEGFGEKEAREFKPIFIRFIKSYNEKDPAVSDKDWLATEYRREMPELSEEKAAEMAAETVNSIAEYDKNLTSLNEACATGKSKEMWFADKMAEAAVGVSVVEYGNYLDSIDKAMETANKQMEAAITTKKGAISMNRNLDGFIAEQYPAGSFNVKSTIKKGLTGKNPFGAVQQTPANGKYAKNSVDVTIRDQSKPNAPIVQRYQVKYGKDAPSTIRMLRESGTKTRYGNQQIVVPPDQVEQVQAAFPGKTVRSTIGIDGVESTPLSKEAAKEMQLKAQKEGVLPETNYNSFKTREMALNLGKSAVEAGVKAALITTGISLAQSVFSDEEIDDDKTIDLALNTGADASVKTVAAGALKMGVETGVIGIIPKGTPSDIIAQIACVGVENIKIMGKVANGDLSAAEGLDHMGRTTTSMVAGLSAGAKGMAIGTFALSWIPLAGPLVGGLVGGMVGYMAGSKVGNAIYSGAKKVYGAAKSVVKSIAGGIKRAGGVLKRTIFSH